MHITVCHLYVGKGICVQEHIIYSTDRAKFAATSQALTASNTAAAVYMTHKLLHTLHQVLHQPAYW